MLPKLFDLANKVVTTNQAAREGRHEQEAPGRCLRQLSPAARSIEPGRNASFRVHLWVQVRGVLPGLVERYGSDFIDEETVEARARGRGAGPLLSIS